MNKFLNPIAVYTRNKEQHAVVLRVVLYCITPK